MCIDPKNRKLFVFNPTCEMAIANGNIAWSPNKHMQQFEKDLEYLPILFTKGNDLLAVHKKPSTVFAKWLNKTIKIQPLLIDRTHMVPEIENYGSFPAELHPWGWSPTIYHTLKNLMPYTSDVFRKGPNGEWSNDTKKFYSRKTALALLKTIVREHSQEYLLPPAYHPVVAKTVEEVEQRFRKWPQIVLKAPWSASGRGIQILRYRYLNKSNVQWINSVLNQQGYIMVEPLLDKVADFSLHFKINAENIEYIGSGQFTTNVNGQYEQNIIKPKKTQTPVPLSSLAKWITGAMTENRVNTFYRGFAGVDLMTIKINEKTYIHPLVEVNWRYNMGLVALQLEKFIHPNSKGSFKIHVNPKIPFFEIHKQHTAAYPLTIKEGLPYSGYFPLSDPEIARSGAYVILKANV